jgi:hypothetical protein
MNRCYNLCCKSNIVLIQLYVEKKWTAKQVAKFCGSSSPHILKRLRELNVKMRERKDYSLSRGGRKPRVHWMWKVSEKALRETPMSLWKERKKLSSSEWHYAYNIRRRRLREIDGRTQTLLEM